MRRFFSFFALAACLELAPPAHAVPLPGFTHYLDGATLPGDAGWTVELAPGEIVDLGDGNFVILQADNNTSATSGQHGGQYDEYYLTLGDPANTLATRFMVLEYSGTSPAINMLALTAAGDAGPAIGVGIRNLDGVDSWALLRFIAEANDPANPAHTLVNLGPALPGEFNTAFIHIDSATDLVRVNWNGAEVYNQITPTDWGGGVGFPEFGASNYWAEGGASTVAFDWVGYGPGYIIPEPSTLAIAIAGLLTLLARRKMNSRPAPACPRIRKR
jgi:hypothetical protein